MTNKEILEIAMQQSAIDSSCKKSDFLKSKNMVVNSKPNPRARKCLKLPFFCNFTSYGNNIVASVNPKIADFVKDYINSFEVPYCFETPNTHVLNKELNKHGMQIYYMAEFFIPDVNLLKPKICDYELRILEPKDFTEFYRPQWRNALSEKRKHLDILGIGAYDNEKLIGLAACSNDCETMWQVGIDVLPEYRRQGIASALTSNLAIEILNRGKVPFYCTAWSNIKSVKNAIKSGFTLAWIQLTAKELERNLP